MRGSRRIMRPRAVWRETMRRIKLIEDRQEEINRLLDAVFSDATYEHGAGVGLNGQDVRKAIVRDLFDRLGFSLVVETGAHFGDTTGYLATEYGVPVHTCEVAPRYFYVARHRLRGLETAHVHSLDSRQLLKQLADDDAVPAQRTLFYLDAHWYDDLPLAEEIELIASNWSEWVALVDDFKVPGDDGYGYDDYGGGNSLTLEYLGPVLNRHGIPAFFPMESSEVETGARRGSLLTCATALRAAVAGSPALRELQVAQD